MGVWEIIGKSVLNDCLLIKNKKSRDAFKRKSRLFYFFLGTFFEKCPEVFLYTSGGSFSSLVSRPLFRYHDMFFFYAMSCLLPLFPNIVVMVLLGVTIRVIRFWWRRTKWGWIRSWLWRRRVWRSRNHRFFYYREYRARWLDILAIALSVIYHFCCHLICPYIFTLLLSCPQWHRCLVASSP